MLAIAPGENAAFSALLVVRIIFDYTGKPDGLQFREAGNGGKEGAGGVVTFLK
jgi:hypothetical protein